MNNSQSKYIFNGVECLLYSMKAGGLDLFLNHFLQNTILYEYSPIELGSLDLL